MQFLILLLISILGLTICKEEDEYTKKNWWKHTNIYQIYLLSFKDSDGDGLGDIRGLTNKLEYLAELGVETIWLSPFYQSPDEHNGYEVANYTDIHPRFGTMDDFDNLMSKLKKLGMKIMIDFLANNCGRNHIWFDKSVEGIEPYIDYFVWKNPKGYDNNGNPIPPNNWLSLRDTSAWSWIEQRKQYYYHLFGDWQPDFNLKNSNVMNELKEVLRFWLSKGVDAIRFVAVTHYIEDERFLDEPWTDPYDRIKYSSMDHIYTADLIENYKVVEELRDFVEEEFTEKDNYTRLVCTVPASSRERTIGYYDNSNRKIAHFPYNHELITVYDYPTSPEFFERIHNWIDNIPEGAVPNWVSGNHDSPRNSAKQGKEFTDMYLILVTMLPGVSITYYGQEIGMEDAVIRKGQNEQINRSPMQWDDTINSGFTTNPIPWVPVNSNYWRINAEAAKNDTNSLYHVFKKLLKIRKTHTAKFGDVQTYNMTLYTFAFTRTYPNYETLITVFNFGSTTEVLNLAQHIPNLSDNLRILTYSINAGYKSGDVVPSKIDEHHPEIQFKIRPKSAIVLTTYVDNPEVEELPEPIVTTESTTTTTIATTTEAETTTVTTTTEAIISTTSKKETKIPETTSTTQKDEHTKIHETTEKNIENLNSSTSVTSSILLIICMTFIGHLLINDC